MSTTTDRAVILAGGMGTRLRPYTVVLPKPLMPIGQYPILEVVVRQLARHGFRRVTMAVNHQADLIRAFFGDGARWGLEIDYSLESVPLSTIGPLKLVKDLPERFLLMNGDVLTDLNFRDLCDAHVSGGRLFTIAAATRTLNDLRVAQELGQRSLKVPAKSPDPTRFIRDVGAPAREALQRFPLPARQQAVERLNRTVGRVLGRGFIPGL